MLEIEVSGDTDKGLHRDHNEDGFLVLDGKRVLTFSNHEIEVVSIKGPGLLLCVADGMGGANAGEVASQTAIETIKKEFGRINLKKSGSPQKYLSKLLQNAHKEILNLQRKNSDLSGMGTTLILAWILGDRAYLIWSGDSRAYLITSGAQTRPITDDHSMVWDLVKTGQVTPEEARAMPESNLILQCLGDPLNPPKPDCKEVLLYKGDKLLLCSDGLNGMLPDQEIFDHCSAEISSDKIIKNLIQEANSAGGHDNITAVMAVVSEGDPVPKTAKTVEIQTGNNSEGRGLKFRASVFLGLVLLLVSLAYFGVGSFKAPESIESDDSMPEFVFPVSAQEETGLDMREDSSLQGKPDFLIPPENQGESADLDSITPGVLQDEDSIKKSKSR